jgi:putative hydrolase of the HAD superfamily
MLIKNVLFDLNNVIENYKAYKTKIPKIIHRVLKDSGFHIDPNIQEKVNKEYNFLSGLLESTYIQHYPFFWEVLIKNVYNKKLDINQIRKIYSNYVQQYASEIEMYNDTKGILKYLKQRYRLGIIANGDSERIRKFLQKKQILKYFDTIVTSGNTPYSKPDRQLFNLALYGLKANPVNSIMVGDRLDSDVFGANRVGIWSVRIQRSRDRNQNPIYTLEDPELKVPDYTINKLTDLKTLTILSQETVLRQAVLLSGGKGTRMGKCTENTQKCAIKYKNIPIICRPVQAILNNDIKNLCFITFFKKSDIYKLIKKGIAYNAKTQIFDTGEKTTGDALYHIKDFLDDWFIYCHGDIIFDSVLLTQAIKRFYKNGCKKPVVCITKNPIAPTHPVIDLQNDIIRVVRGEKVHQLGKKQFYSIGLSILSKKIFFITSREKSSELMTEEYLSGMKKNSIELLEYNERWLHFCTEDDLYQRDINSETAKE